MKFGGSPLQVCGILLVWCASFGMGERSISGSSMSIGGFIGTTRKNVEHTALPFVVEDSLTTEMAPLRGGSAVVNAGGAVAGNALLERLRIGCYFALWYFLNVIYNIMNKKLMNTLPAPLTLGTIQLWIGGAYAALLWLVGLRARPNISSNVDFTKVKNQVGFCHGAGQLCSMASMGAGPISFTHIVKAMEPFFSAACSALIVGKWMPVQVYATLLPVVGGVGYACMQEPSFSMLAFLTAMGSNLAFALRAVLSKSAMDVSITAPNLFALVTLSSAVWMTPFALVLERSTFATAWKSALETTNITPAKLVQTVLLSGLLHYLNNEVMYLCLGNVHPVTLAVGNTMKRVFILVASVIVFRNPISTQAGIGSSIGLLGVLLYSLTKAHYEALERQQNAAATSSKKHTPRKMARA